MNYKSNCLSIDQLKTYLFFRRNLIKIDDIPKDLLEQLELSSNWNLEMVITNYFVARILDQENLNDLKRNDLINFVRNMAQEPDEWVSIEPYDFNFIKNMLNTVKDKEISLEENLIQLTNNIKNQVYDNIVRD